MEAAAHPAVYKEIVAVLIAAGVIIPLFRKLGVSSILGFLLVGILAGPHALGQLAESYTWLQPFALTDPERIATLAEFGIVFLLFMIGIELPLERLVAMRRLVFGLGGIQVFASTSVIAWIIWMLGSPPVEAAVIGAALALSSTAIVIEILSDQRRLGTQTGRAAFSILLLQDLAVIPILFLIGAFGAPGEHALGSSLILAVGKTLLAIGGILVVGRYLLRPFLRVVAETRSADFFMAAALLIAAGAGLVASFAGMSMAMGAFLAGLLLAETEYRREIEAIIEPFKGVMLGAFFMLVGMRLDLGEVVAHPFAIVALAAAMILVKAAIIVLAGTLFRLTHRARVETALLLGPGGEFAFVALGLAMASGIVRIGPGETALLVVSISMAAIPVFARLGSAVSRRIEKRVTAPELIEAPPEDVVATAIVVGHGRVGHLVTDLLKEHGVSHLIVETDPAIVTRERKNGAPIYYGDATRPEFLRRCGIERAKAIAVTMDAPSKVDEVVAAARKENQAIKIVARALDETHAARLYELGVTEAVPEAFEASLQLGEAMLVDSGIAMGLAIASVHERRDQHRKTLGRPNRKEQLARLRRRATIE
jgi:CPA2 family monovalent cation:H+ antiporter-2